MSYKNLYFDDSLFLYIPDEIRIFDTNDIKIGKRYDENGDVINDVVGDVYITATMEKYVEIKKRYDKMNRDLLQGLTSNIYRIIGFDDHHEKYQEYKQWIKTLLNQIKQNPEKNLILSNLDIHVAPKWQGNRYLNKGELRIYNILDAKYRFEEPYYD